MKELLRRRWDGTFTVDEWGLDRDLVDLTGPLFALRWNISVTGAGHIPDDGPAVLVFNRRLGLSEPFVVPRGIRVATGRHVRVAGVIDVAPAGTALRRLGGILGDPDEVAGLLRAGRLVGLGLGREPLQVRGVGELDDVLLAPGVESGVPVLPCAVRGLELGRRWRIVVGPPVGYRSADSPRTVLDRLRSDLEALLRSRRGPLAPVDIGSGPVR